MGGIPQGGMRGRGRFELLRWLGLLADIHYQKFKVRIEDPPRRRHMVFLGGAVLANIVSLAPP